jgi:tetratricopeptide (TPR) repeat protein
VQSRRIERNRFDYFMMILLFLLFLGTTFPSQAQETIHSTVEGLLAKGDIDEAKRILREWLLENGDAESFPSLLDRYLFLESDISIIREFLSRLLESVKMVTHKALIWKKKAIIEELTGRIDLAQEAYKRAADLSPSEIKSLYLLESARLLYEQGFSEKASDELSLIFLTTDNVEVTSRAMLLRAYIYIENGKISEAEKVLRSILENPSMSSVKPQVLLTLVFLNREKPEGYKAYLSTLELEFPKSPEYALAQKIVGQETDVTFYFTPKLYLSAYRDHDSTEESPSKENEEVKGAREERTFFVQTGSFLVKENADYMVTDLEKIGMRAGVRMYKKEDKTYYRVYVLDLVTIEQAQQILIKLKEHGFEGFITFEN